MESILGINFCLQMFSFHLILCCRHLDYLKYFATRLLRVCAFAGEGDFQFPFKNERK